MARKCPRVGDIVRLLDQTVPFSARLASLDGWVTKTEGIHLYIQFFAPPWAGHSGKEFRRRDSVEVLSYANLR